MRHPRGPDIRVPQEDYGKFYSGDSYIVLKTTVPQRGPKQWDLFFWLGEETTADESGIAAYKTVELGARAAAQRGDNGRGSLRPL